MALGPYKEAQDVSAAVLAAAFVVIALLWCSMSSPSSQRQWIVNLAGKQFFSEDTACAGAIAHAFETTNLLVVELVGMMK